MFNSLHECRLPRGGNRPVGFIWICNAPKGDKICGRVYQIRGDAGGRYWKRCFPWDRAWWISSN